MKKILFWIDDGFVQFGVANFLQKQSDHELYCIYDTNHVTKNFFKSQNFINFKKSWIFRDFLEPNNKTFDLEYLKEVEKKYNLNLWQIAYSDRRLYGYNEYYKFNREEILSITVQECKIFEKILLEVNPDFILIGVTDLHRNYLFTELYRGAKIPILMLWPLRDGRRCIISQEYETLDEFEKSSNQISDSTTKAKSQDYFKQSSAHKVITDYLNKRYATVDFKLSKFDIVKRHLHFLFYVCNDDYRKFYENWGHTRLKFLTKKDFVLPFIFKRWSRKLFLDKHSRKNVSLNEPFVYYPLHHEPERTILIDAPFFTNQIELIRHLAKALPIDHKLYVKEHFSMKVNAWRDKSFYKQILELPNVVLIHPSVSPEPLLQHCSFVATISGTAALEAGFLSKPSIFFSDSSFSYLPFIIRVTNIEKLPDIMKECLENKYDYSSMNGYISLIDKISFEVDWIKIQRFVASKLHGFNGMTKEVLITTDKVEEVFNDCKSEFEILAFEYLKKISNYNNQ